MSELADRECIPCRGDVPALPPDAARKLLEELGGAWGLVDDKKLQKQYEFPDFAGALAFTNRAAAVAEAQNHHPDIHLAWGKVGIEIWTHKIDGLTESDFVLAAKCDAVL